MNCKMDKRFLYEYSDGTIGDLEKIFAEEHIKVCPSCRRELQLIKDIDASIKNITEEIELPDRLSLISELVADNCVSQLDTSGYRLRDAVKSYVKINHIVLGSMNTYKNNPYDTYMKKNMKSLQRSVKTTLGFIGKPALKLIKKNLPYEGFLSRLKII